MNERIFEERFMLIAPKLYGIAYLIVKGDADAQDAVQEALIRAWKKLRTLKNEDYFDTWLIRILVNESKRILKKGKAAGSGALTQSIPQRAVDNAPLRDAVRALPVNYRVPIVLYYLQGYSTSEMAQIMRVPVTTVKWRLYQGRALLKETLSRKEAEL